MELPKTIKMKQEKLKHQLLDAILFECTNEKFSEDVRHKNCLKYADKFSNKLLPNETSISGDSDKDPIKVEFPLTEEQKKRVVDEYLLEQKQAYERQDSTAGNPAG